MTMMIMMMACGALHKCMAVKHAWDPQECGVPEQTIADAKMLRAASPTSTVIEIVGKQIAKELEHIVRDFDFFEICAGSGGFTTAMRNNGFVGGAFDKVTRHKSEDLVSLPGMLHVVRQIARVRRGGYVWSGIPCCTFVWMSRTHTQRYCADPLGNTSRKDVRRANIMGRHQSYIFSFCVLLGIKCLLEQPGSSLFIRLPCIEDVMRTLGLRKMYTWLSAFGHELPKPTYLVHNLPTHIIEHFLRRRCTLKSAKKKLANKIRDKYYKKIPSKSSDRVWTTGQKGLKGSENYPEEFCESAALMAVYTRMRDTETDTEVELGAADVEAQAEPCTEDPYNDAVDVQSVSALPEKVAKLGLMEMLGVEHSHAKPAKKQSASAKAVAKKASASAKPTILNNRIVGKSYKCEDEIGNLCYHCKHPTWKRKCLGTGGGEAEARADFEHRMKRIKEAKTGKPRVD